MPKRLITIIVSDDHTGDHAICEGDQFVAGLSMDELIGRVNMLILTGKAGLGNEGRADYERSKGREPRWWDYHPLRHGGHDPKLGDPPVKPARIPPLDEAEGGVVDAES